MATRELLNVRETARRLGVHENTVRNWERNGVLHALRLPGSGYRRFALADIERMRDEMWRELPATKQPAIRRSGRRIGRVVSGDALE